MTQEAAVLIVDDDGQARKTLADILQLKGYRAVAAAGGRSAILKAEEEKPAAALIDLKMRDMPGLDVLREIKKRSPGTECIVVTGYASQATAVDSVNVGAYGYVQKPYDLKQLLLMIRRAVEKNQAETAMRESEERFRVFFENAPEYCYVVSPDLMILDVNRTALTVLGCQKDRLIGKPFQSICAPESLPTLQGLFDEWKKTGRLKDKEMLIVAKEGERRVVLLSAETVRCGDGSVSFSVTVQRDVTERKRAEEALRQSQKVEALGRLAGGIAHDFNNQLTAISGYAEIGTSIADLSEQGRRCFVEISQAARRAAALTRRLLAFSRRQPMALRTINLNDVLVDAQTILSRLIPESVELDICRSDGLWLARADPSQLEHVVINLALNARDAMPGGGKLTVEAANVSLCQPCAAWQSSVPPGQYVALSVSDTGCGMTKEVMARLFEPFFTTKEAGRGTGLGLATCQSIVKQCGGHIAVNSKPGRGTTFRIYLQRSDDTVSLAPHHAEQNGLPHGKETILLVEDDVTVRSLAADVLRQLGYTVVEAANGIEALQIAERCGPQLDLVVSDIVMPQMGGRALGEHLNAVRPDIKVLFTSGYYDEMIEWAKVPVTVEDGLLEKPFTAAALARKVRQALDSRPAAAGGSS